MTNGHGTFTAGEIGAVGNNGIGVAGVNWNVQLMPVQFLDSSGSGTDTAAAEAIDYAVDHGAKVINASWGGGGTDPTIDAAIQYADQHGVIIVAAAGNNGIERRHARFFSPGLVLGAVPQRDLGRGHRQQRRAGVAGPTTASARSSWPRPGVNVYSTTSSGSYGTDSGTSMAAPLVTGTIALVEAAHPSWSMSQVIDAVLDPPLPTPTWRARCTTGGIVNAAAAVANTDGPYVVSATPDGSINSASGAQLGAVDLQRGDQPGDLHRRRRSPSPGPAARSAG